MSVRIDTATIQIERIIVHDIPKHKRDNNGIEPSYSEKESVLTDKLRLFFKEKVVSSLNSDNCFRVCYDSSNTSPIQLFTSDLLNSTEDKLVEISKSMAKHLYDIQDGSNTAGIFVVILGKVSTREMCILMKLERDQGAQLKLDENTKSYSIAEVENLMLTRKTRIFKVALFISRNNFKVQFDGLLMDHQINILQKKETKSWFIDKFLGCKAFEDPRITTKNFFNLTRSFIETIPDDIERAKYYQDLNSYVQKNSAQISLSEFANDYFLTTSLKDSYRDYMKTKNFDISIFPKDISSIESRVKRLTVLFENDISIIGTKGTFEKKVKLEKLEDGRTKAEIVSKIKNIV